MFTFLASDSVPLTDRPQPGSPAAFGGVDAASDGAESFANLFDGAAEQQDPALLQSKQVEAVVVEPEQAEVPDVVLSEIDLELAMLGQKKGDLLLHLPSNARIEQLVAQKNAPSQAALPSIAAVALPDNAEIIGETPLINVPKPDAVRAAISMPLMAANPRISEVKDGVVPARAQAFVGQVPDVDSQVDVDRGAPAKADAVIRKPLSRVGQNEEIVRPNAPLLVQPSRVVETSRPELTSRVEQVSAYRARPEPVLTRSDSAPKAAAFSPGLVPRNDKQGPVNNAETRSSSVDLAQTAVKPAMQADLRALTEAPLEKSSDKPMAGMGRDIAMPIAKPTEKSPDFVRPSVPTPEQNNERLPLRAETERVAQAPSSMQNQTVSQVSEGVPHKPLVERQPRPVATMSGPKASPGLEFDQRPEPATVEMRTAPDKVANQVAAAPPVVLVANETKTQSGKERPTRREVTASEREQPSQLLSSPNPTTTAPVAAVQTFEPALAGNKAATDFLKRGSEDIEDSRFSLHMEAEFGQSAGPLTEGRAAQASAPVGQAQAAQSAGGQMAQAMVQSKGGQTELVLDPKELGKVRLSMVSEDRTITMHVLAERPETLELLRRNIELLEREFRELGFEDVTFAFGDKDQSDAEAESGASMSGEPEQFEPEPIAAARATAGPSDSHLDIRL